MTRGRKPEDLSGRVVGAMTVLRRHGTRGYETTWIANCAECSKEHVVGASVIRRGVGMCPEKKAPPTHYTHHGVTRSLNGWARHLHRDARALAKRVATMPLDEALSPSLAPRRGACAYCSKQTHHTDADGDFVCHPGRGCAKGLAA